MVDCPCLRSRFRLYSGENRPDLVESQSSGNLLRWTMKSVGDIQVFGAPKDMIKAVPSYSHDSMHNAISPLVYPHR